MVPQVAAPAPAQPPQPQEPPPVTIDAVVQLLRNERMRGFRIDIETDSLVEADQTQERQDANELITGIATFFKEFGPIVQQMPPLAPMASQLLCFAVRRYKVGSELEEVIEKAMGEVQQRLLNPPPPQPNPVEQAKIQQAQIKAQAEGMKAQAGIQQVAVKGHVEQQKAQMDMAAKAMDHQHATAKHYMDMQKMQAEVAIDAQALQHDAKALQMKADANEHGHKLKIEQMDHQAKMAKQKPEGNS